MVWQIFQLPRTLWHINNWTIQPHIVSNKPKNNPTDYILWLASEPSAADIGSTHSCSPCVTCRAGKDREKPGKNFRDFYDEPPGHRRDLFSRFPSETTTSSSVNVFCECVRERERERAQGREEQSKSMHCAQLYDKVPFYTFHIV